MKLSLRSQKINSNDVYIGRLNHNSRVSNSETFDSDFSDKNVSKISKFITPNLEDFWLKVRADFDAKKALNIIDSKRRFLKRKSTKTTKDKNGKKKTEQINTSIIREFVLQIGNEFEHLEDEKSLELYQKIQDYIIHKYKLTMLRSDIHLDEKTPHLHFFASTYNFATGEFSKEFAKANSYGKMQDEVLAYARTLLPELEDKVEKDCKVADYIEPVVYRRNKELLDKAKEYCENGDLMNEELQSSKAYKDKLLEENEALRADIDNHKKQSSRDLLKIYPDATSRNDVFDFVENLKKENLELKNSVTQEPTTKYPALRFFKNMILDIFEDETDNQFEMLKLFESYKIPLDEVNWKYDLESFLDENNPIELEKLEAKIEARFKDEKASTGVDFEQSYNSYSAPSRGMKR